ncbi:MAG: transposase [Chloroflexales bacterium]|nr:transposase [Chloroflexales bacterium]
MSEQPTIQTERVDDVPLLLAHMQRLGLPTILDAHFPTHGNHQGLSLGFLCLVWLAHILSRADHRLNRVRPWAEQLQVTLNAVLPNPLRPTDLTDDRLADVLQTLSDDAAWAACEGALNQRILRVYDLAPTTVRVDGTTASGYWEVTADGLFQFGHSKDHRPDQPQLKVMLATLDPLGLPVAVDVLPGQRSDDRLYLPIIVRVRTSLARSGLLYVGDSKLGALGTRAHLQQAGDQYLCPLGRVQLDAEQLAGLVEAALAAPALALIHRPTAEGTLLVDDDGTPVVTAEAWETSAELTAEVEGVPVTWSERRVLVRSRALQTSQGQALERRLTQAEADLAALLVPRRGKERPTTPPEAEAAIAVILDRHQVGGLLMVTLAAEAQTRTIRAYRGQPAREETTYTMTVSSQRNDGAIGAAVERLGWQVYVTNRPVAQLALEQVVLAYRDQYLVEHPIGRLKGVPLSLSPVYLSRDDHVTGLVRLLTIGVRVLCALEYGVRQNLALAPADQTLTGLYAGQPNRQTRRPTAERILEAFRNLTLTVVELPNQIIRHLTPLSALQQRLLALAGLEPTCYLRLVEHSSEPPG